MAHVVPAAAAGPLTCGRLSATLTLPGLEQIDVDHRAVAPRIGVSVRDPLWGTVPAVVRDVVIEERTEAVSLSFTCAHDDGSIGFDWAGMYVLHGDGTLTAEMDGVARRAFRYARIGFDVLHPLSWCGRPFEAGGPDGQTRGTLPCEIAPQVAVGDTFEGMFDPFSNLEVEVSDTARVRFDFEGDLFETEDQRNWTDASFKTYCTPLRGGQVHDAKAGQRFFQRVTMTVHGDPSAAAAAIAASGPVSLPRLGVRLREPLTAASAALLRGVGLDHVRVDTGSSEAALIDAARDLGAGIELAVHTDAAGGLPPLELSGARIDRCIVLHGDSLVAPPQAVRAVRRLLLGQGVDVPVGAGTDLDFAEFNRERWAVDGSQLVAYPVTPQVHAFSDHALFETLPVQAATVITARRFAGTVPVVVSPITLRPHAAEPDPRQATQLAASWLAGSITSLTAGGAAAATYFDATGPGGLIAGGRTLPVFEVLREACALAGRRIVRAEVGVGWSVLAAEGSADTRLLIANLGPDDLAVAGFGGEACELAPVGASAAELEHSADVLELGGYGVVRVTTAPSFNVQSVRGMNKDD